MHVQNSCFAHHPKLLLLGLITVLTVGHVHPTWAEPCITCRTPACPKKAGIVAWCGIGIDPKHRARTNKSAPKRPLQSTDTSEKTSLILPDNLASAPLDAAAPAEPSLSSLSTAAAGTELHMVPSSAPALLSKVPERVDSLAFSPLENQAPMIATPVTRVLELSRSEGAASNRSKKTWIATGVSTGAGLAITATVLAIVLTSLSSRCSAPLGSVSLNECN